MKAAPPDRKQLRKFGLLVGGISGFIGLWPMVARHQDPRLLTLALAVVLAVPALLRPQALGPVYRAWMVVGNVLGSINTRIILGVLFYGLITPMGVVMRVWGRDPMRRTFEPGVDSYRVVARPRSGTHMTRQF